MYTVKHKLFINLRLRQINSLRSSALFLKSLRSAAGKFTHSAACGTTYVPPTPPPTLNKLLCYYTENDTSTKIRVRRYD